MSYQVLARKWRPRNFQEVIGQQHVLTALSNGLAQNRLHHAYLFSGTRGVGKTTIARILAKSLNCELGVTATPCGKCAHCQAIDQGRFVDLLEIDAASRTKVDDTRELLDNVQYKPAQGRYKVYLIDEVHMLSKHSFNALLKTLEEPPEYVKFLLATTDPQKLPITVLSRCLQFHLKAILPEEIEKQLGFILGREHATFEHAALAVIAKAADGSMRDALSLTDQALAFGSGNIQYQSVLKMLGTIDSGHLSYLLHFIVSGNVQKVFQKIQEFVHLGADFAKLHQDLASLCHQIALLQIQKQSNVSEKTAVQLLAQRLTPEEVQLYYQIALQGYKDYPFAPNGKVALEMTVMRLLAFKPANYIALDDSLFEAEPLNEAPFAAAPVATVHNEPAATAIAPAPVTLEPVNTVETVTANEALSDSNSGETAADRPVAEPDAANVNMESINQVTHSRNMLRSHRLKREEAKKLQATTVNAIAEPIVAVKKAPAAQENMRHDVAIEAQPTDKPFATEIDNSAEIIAEPPAPPSDYEEPLPVDGYWQDNYTASDDIDIDIEDSAPDERFMQADFAQDSELSAAIADNLEGQDCLNEAGFFSDEQLDLPGIDISKYVEDKLTDPWSLLIQQLQLVGLVKLLAKNSVIKQVDQQIILTLKTEQQHLLNNSGLCEQLQAKFKAHYGQQISMYVEVGEVPGQLTPVEAEKRLFQQYLDNAKQAIIKDKNIQILVRDYGAKIYENSIIPL